VLRGAQARLGLVELAEAILPIGFETTGDETVVGIDSTIAALRPLSLVVCAFHSEAPLRKHAVGISFKLFSRGHCSLNAYRLECGENRKRHRLVYSSGAGVEAVDTTAFNNVFAGAVITRRGGAAHVVRAQFAPAFSTHGDPLQQSASFSQRQSLNNAVGDEC
jgi:hypothetical protein